jgi:hypothetical protein
VSRQFIAAIAVAIALGQASSAIAGGPFGTISVEGWKGGGFTNDSGAFSYCAAVKEFASGDTLVLIERPDHTWGLGLSNNS